MAWENVPHLKEVTPCHTLVSQMDTSILFVHKESLHPPSSRSAGGTCHPNVQLSQTLGMTSKAGYWCWNSLPLLGQTEVAPQAAEAWVQSALNTKRRPVQGYWSYRKYQPKVKESNSSHSQYLEEKGQQNAFLPRPNRPGVALGRRATTGGRAHTPSKSNHPDAQRKGARKWIAVEQGTQGNSFLPTLTSKENHGATIWTRTGRVWLTWQFFEQLT